MFKEEYDLDELLKDIAKILFIIKVILYLIVSVVMFVQASNAYRSQEDVYRIMGFVFLIAGPVTAYVSSLIMFALGEIVYRLVKIDNAIRSNKSDDKQSTNKSVEDNGSGHKWRCNSCGKMVDKDPCPYCAEKYSL